MKLWLLRPINPHEGPWDSRFDKVFAFGFVVRAEFERDARALAAEKKGDESEKAWLDSSLSTCVELQAEGSPEVVIWDMHDA